MYDLAVFWEWVSFAVRWLHVITAIAWIGSSFYFIALDLGLRREGTLPPMVHGEEWQVHGGGFYHIQKYLVAPAQIPEHLTWFKWESYATWLSGFVLLCLVYYGGAELYLIDRNVLDVSVGTAIFISLGSIVMGWVLYDQLCKSPLVKSTTLLMVLLYFVLVGMAWGYAQLFAPRAAFLHLGVFTATLMSANVAMIIIPNQKKVVAALVAGAVPNPALGIEAKQRSLHNNYLTLPVIFLMLSNHNPLAFATQYSWIIASLVFLMGVSVRHYFNSKHARKGNATWTWLVTALLFIAIIWLSTNPKLPEMAAQASAIEQRFTNARGFDVVRETVSTRCEVCHSGEPAWEGIRIAPKNVVLDSDIAIARFARQIYLQAGVSRAMPPSNVSGIEPHERQAIVDWYLSAMAGS